uniref:Uncharacterized protein n=1 Tax=Arundo donax TaxID=35708 RepID=A0A0A9DFY1_ARUDO
MVRREYPGESSYFIAFENIMLSAQIVLCDIVLSAFDTKFQGFEYLMILNVW